MTSGATASRPRRRPPEKRRDEIAEAAGRIAATDGLTQVTAKRVAVAVGVYPGLVNHYFRTADDLIAAAFASATEGRRDRQLQTIAADADHPTAELRMFLHDAIAPENDPSALLWLDAWRESPRRPALQREVIRQMEMDVSGLRDLLERGVAAGEFSTPDCAASAIRILAMLDGISAQSAVRTAIAGAGLLNYPVVSEMLLRTTESDLGLRPGTLNIHG